MKPRILFRCDQWPGIELSVTDAADRLGVRPNAVYRSARTGHPVHGHHFARVDEPADATGTTVTASAAPTPSPAPGASP